MSSKFVEHKGLDLTKTNNDVLSMWEKNDIFHKSIVSVKVALSLSSSRDLHLLMVIPAFTTCWLVPLRILSTDTRP